MVSTVLLNGFIDVEKVAEEDKLFEYFPEIYPGLIFRVDKPRISFLLFSNGKVVCTGGKNVAEVKNGIEELCLRLRKTGALFGPVSEIKIRNIVGTADFGQLIDIELIATRIRTVVYEPEQFPAIIYRVEGGKIVALIFNSGKIVITGAKTEEELESGFARIQDTILSIKPDEKQ